MKQLRIEIHFSQAEFAYIYLKTIFFNVFEIPSLKILKAYPHRKLK